MATEYVNHDTVRHLAAKRLEILGMLQMAGTCADEWLLTDVISRGSYARVYRLGNDRIVKITMDDSDARAAEHVRRLQDRGDGSGRNLVRVYYVCTLYQNPAKRWDHYYMIVSERLDELPAPLWRHCDYYHVTEMMGTSDVVRGAQMYADGTNDLGLGRAESWGIAAAINLHGVTSDLLAAGITGYTDWHQRNVMYRWEGAYGRVVLVDLGCSTSPHVEFEADMPLRAAA